jgi:hypothetical protein
MVHYQLSTGKQYSGDSYREQDFIQTNPHSTFSHRDSEVPSSSTLASQQFTQALPKPCSLCDVVLANKGSPAELQGILMAGLSCRSSLMVHQQHLVVR